MIKMIIICANFVTNAMLSLKFDRLLKFPKVNSLCYCSRNSISSAYIMSHGNGCNYVAEEASAKAEMRESVYISAAKNKVSYSRATRRKPYGKKRNLKLRASENI